MGRCSRRGRRNTVDHGVGEVPLSRLSFPRAARAAWTADASGAGSCRILGATWDSGVGKIACCRKGCMAVGTARAVESGEAEGSLAPSI